VIQREDRPLELLEDWTRLYSELIDRHDIRGVAAFSKASFARQLAVPGIVMLRATHDGATVAIHLWYAVGNVAYYHLAASDQKGYECSASYALMAFAADYFRDIGIRWLDLGAGPGLSGPSSAGTDGLSRFKRGWSNTTRRAWFCGRILDRQRYQEATRSGSVPETRFFPAYRFPGAFN
jgi:hypothetical protein